jgi:hypothetical protein
VSTLLLCSTASALILSAHAPQITSSVNAAQRTQSASRPACAVEAETSFSSKIRSLRSSANSLGGTGLPLPASTVHSDRNDFSAWTTWVASSVLAASEKALGEDNETMNISVYTNTSHGDIRHAKKNLVPFS